MCDVSECDRGTSTMRRLRTTKVDELFKKKICVYNYVVPRFPPYPRNCEELQNMFLRSDGFIPSPKSQDKDSPFFRLSVTAY